ncbi:MAG: hypothetical protein JNN03_16805 [Rubrivivax sp.]|nr:hypothetical protein [Rubrivivax sp.]
MLATFARLVTGQPSGLLRHLALYGTLVQAETGYAAQRLARRVALGIAALLLLGCAVTLAGVAALLASAGLAAGTPAAFWWIPGLALAAALVTGWLAARAEPVPPYASLRQQLAADAGWLVQAAEPVHEPAASPVTAGTPAAAAPAAAAGTTGTAGASAVSAASASPPA